MNEIFFEFIKYHTPKFIFLEKSNKYSFCLLQMCDYCKIYNICPGVKNTFLTLEKYQEIKEKYPEYFI